MRFRALLLLPILLLTACATVDTPVPEPPPVIPTPERPAQLPDSWTAAFEALSAEERIGQLLMLEVRDPGSGRFLKRLDQKYRDWAAEIQPGGFILFADNLADPEQTRLLIEDLSRLTRIPPFIALDEEGGVVSRLNAVPAMGATPLPSARAIGAGGDPAAAAAAAGTIAAELAELGFNVDFAPVADVHVPGSGGAIGERSYGTDPRLVARMAGEFAAALEARGVLSVAKHFPGHGAARGDSHNGRTLLDASDERITGRELVPFVETINRGIGGIMLGHITVPALDPQERPASLSSEVIEGVLRARLGFRGLVFTDSLRMRAVTAYYDAAALPLLAFEAGADILLMPVLPRESRDLLLEAAASGRVTRERLEESLTRIREAKRRFLAPPRS